MNTTKRVIELAGEFVEVLRDCHYDINNIRLNSKNIWAKEFFNILDYSNKIKINDNVLNAIIDSFLYELSKTTLKNQEEIEKFISTGFEFPPYDSIISYMDMDGIRFSYLKEAFDESFYTEDNSLLERAIRLEIEDVCNFMVSLLYSIARVSSKKF